MHETLITIQDHLKKVITQLQSSIPSEEPFGNAHGNWSFPGITKAELIEDAQSIIDMIEDRGAEELGDAEPRIKDYTRRLTYLQTSTIPNLWNNAGPGVSAYMFGLPLEHWTSPMVKIEASGGAYEQGWIFGGIQS